MREKKSYTKTKKHINEMLGFPVVFKRNIIKKNGDIVLGDLSFYRKNIGTIKIELTVDYVKNES